jgi:transglutaminase-like putative cysteine protease
LNGNPANFCIVHETSYRFDVARSSCDIAARLTPPTFAGQRIVATRIEVSPAPTARLCIFDQWDNIVDHLKLTGPLGEITIVARSRISMAAGQKTAARYANPAAFFSVAPDEACSPNGAIWRWAAQCLPDAAPAPLNIEELCGLIRRDFAYDSRGTAASRSISEIFAACRGVCQDFASLAIAVLRARGMTCRFNSGYLLHGASEEPRVIALHAWFSVWFPDRGWVDFDPLAPRAPRVLLARGISQADTSPVSGFSAGPEACQHMHAVIILNLLEAGSDASGERLQQEMA